MIGPIFHLLLADSRVHIFNFLLHKVRIHSHPTGRSNVKNYPNRIFSNSKRNMKKILQFIDLTVHIYPEYLRILFFFVFNSISLFYCIYIYLLVFTLLLPHSTLHFQAEPVLPSCSLILLKRKHKR
jgi:hypothetical protein